jgi:hypothetical protein
LDFLIKEPVPWARFFVRRVVSSFVMMEVMKTKRRTIGQRYSPLNHCLSQIATGSNPVGPTMKK